MPRSITRVCSFSPPNFKETGILLALLENGGTLHYEAWFDEFMLALDDGINSRKRLLRKLVAAKLVEKKEGAHWTLTKRGKTVALSLKTIRIAMTFPD